MQSTTSKRFASLLAQLVAIACLATVMAGCWAEVEYTKPDPSTAREEKPEPTEPPDIKLPEDNQTNVDPVESNPAPRTPARTVAESSSSTSQPSITPPSTPATDLFTIDEEPFDGTTDQGDEEPAASHLFSEPSQPAPPAVAESDLPTISMDSELPTLPDLDDEEELPDLDSLVDSDALEEKLFGHDSSEEPDAEPPVDDSPPELPAGLALPGNVMPPAHTLPSDMAPPPGSTARSREMAWLLGSKLSLSALGSDRGAPTDKVNEWFGEARTLANSLGTTLTDLPPPPDAPGNGPVGGRTLDYLFQLGRHVGRDLAQSHGPDHAALFEVAFKSNVLLVLYEPGDSLVAAIATAIENAAPRANLPTATWQPLVEAINSKVAPDDLQQAVFQMYDAVEVFLEPSLEASQNSSDVRTDSRY